MKRRSRWLLAATVAVMLSFSPLTIQYLTLVPEFQSNLTVPTQPFVEGSWQGLWAAGRW